MKATCPAKGCTGAMEPYKAGSPEQKFCGEWFRCTRCTSSVLVPSRELAAQWAKAKAVR